MQRTINLIPMAGAGQRFRDAGYALPKPLIPAGGVPMVVRAADSLPSADRWVFVCRQEHVHGDGMDKELRRLFSPCEIVTVDHLTEGQACTCLLAEGHLRPDDQLHIGACDNAMTWDRTRFEAAMADTGADAWIWTFRNNPAVLQNPRMYGWVEVGDGRRATRVSCKVPLSDQPMKDHAVIGAFSFRRASDFLAMAHLTIERNVRVNGEFYMDTVMDVAIQEGLRVKVFEVDHYICWGTPRDLELYEYWRGYFKGEKTRS